MSYGQPSRYGYGPPQHPYGHHGYGYGPGPGMPMRPTPHPNATTALALGLMGVFCLGAFLGVPAIMLGRGVVRSIANEPHRAWTGEGTAKTAIVLGWVSVFETALLVTSALARGWAAALFMIVVTGAGLVLLALSTVNGLPSPVAAVSRALRRAPLAVGLTLGGALMGSIFGLLGTVADAQQAARRCENARSKYAAIGKGEDFAATRSALGDLERECKPAAAELATMRRDVDVKEAETKRRKEEEERAHLAKLAAEKEKNAVETFPQKSKEISQTIAAAQAKAWQGKIELAASELDAAQRALDEFKGTTIEQSSGFTDLAAQIAEKRKAIQPQLDRILEARRKAEEAAEEKRRKAEAAAEEKRRAEEAAAALKAAIRGPKPVNSAWDGSVREVERYLKTVMHDPDSYDHIRSTEPVGEGDYWTVVSSFRGKNAFGALIINTKKFYIQQGEVVKVVDVGG